MKKLQRIPPGLGPLPKWEESVSTTQSIARINQITERWVKRTARDVYLIGKEFIQLKARLDHGEFVGAVSKTPHNIRTVQRTMAFAKECDWAGRLLEYHPNPRARRSLLEPPEEPVKKRAANPEKGSVEWTVDLVVNVCMDIVRKSAWTVEEIDSISAALMAALAQYREERRAELEDDGEEESDGGDQL